jgi:hypothetical protein
MDPYVVCGMIAYTTLVWKPGQEFKSGFNRRLLVLAEAISTHILL